MSKLGRKKWVIPKCNKDSAASIAEECCIDPFAALVLCSRGITEPYEADEFLLQEELCDPFDLPDMEAAVEAVHAAVQAGSHITVFGDYDADGVTSTALLYLYLRDSGAQVDYYIPDRLTEGYGMSCEALKELSERGTELIITVDNGVNAVDEAEYAAKLGMKLVITDHHRSSGEIPNAIAVVDPFRNENEDGFHEWAGVGVAFKLVCALEDGDSERALEEYADLVAIGTVADVVPLKGENRTLVKEGITQLNMRSRVGLCALCDAAGVANKRISSSTVAFALAPRLNAAGRMGSALDAFLLLITESPEEACEICSRVDSANSARRAEEQRIESEIEGIFEREPERRYDRVLVAWGENWHQGVLGIVAAHLCEEYGRPAVVISVTDGVAKGSGRSIEGFSLYDALSAVSGKLTRFGGHTMAAGFSLEPEEIDGFRCAINEYAGKTDIVTPVLNIDCKLKPSALSLSIPDAMVSLEPFGAGNPQPIFGLFNMTITAIFPVGGGKHLRIHLRRETESGITAMYFGMTQQSFGYSRGDKVDVAVRLERSEYMGEAQLSIQIRGIRPADADDDALFACVALYNDFMGGRELSPENASCLYPSREIIAAVYKYIRGCEEGISSEAELTCRAIGTGEKSVGAVRIALDVLSEFGLIRLNDDSRYYVVPSAPKVQLEDSVLLTRLRRFE